VILTVNNLFYYRQRLQKKIALLLSLLFILFLPVASFAFGIEFAGGAWYQSPNGFLSYDKTRVGDDLDLNDDLNYGDEWQPSGRLILDMPLFIPNINIMATPMEWDETGSKNLNFQFGRKTFSANIPFDSKLKMNHLDVALFYGLPLVRKATGDVLNIDLGLNVRLLDFEAKINQRRIGIEESISYLLPLPMLYAGMQIEPLKYLAFEFEGRGIGWNSNYYISVIGRVKAKPYGPFFVAGGYRYDTVKIDYKNVDVEAEIQGPFAEAGFEF